MPSRRPYKIDQDRTETMRSKLMFANIDTGEYEIYITATKRGRCNYKNKNITIPLWAIKNKGWAYALYYACHELSHAKSPATRGDVHGANFMKAFMSICPEHLQHYELKYKPRLATAAGITRNEAIKK